MKTLSDSTLKSMTKAELIEQLRCAEHNYDVAQEFIEQQAKNFKNFAPVRHGRWVKGGYACGESEFICSVCGESEWRTSSSRMKYCMFCGAKMDLEKSK